MSRLNDCSSTYHSYWNKQRQRKGHQADSSPRRSADPDAMQDDGADGAPLTRTTTTDRSVTQQKADRALKKAKIQKRKAAPKPSNAMRFGAGTKKKTRKGGK
jgi:hypothetical protein